MASPQKEKGYTAIANELLEKMISYQDLSGGELKILLTVIRKTYGYRKTTDRISLSQFEEATGYYRANVCRTINKLVAKKLLLKKDSYYKINKNWESWLVAPVITSSSPQATKTSSPQATHKRNKAIIQKKSPAVLKVRQELKGKVKGF